MAFHPRNLPASVQSLFYMNLHMPDQWPAVVQEAIKRGVRDSNKLTDIIFYLRHPDHIGKSLAPGDANYVKLSEEWKLLKTFAQQELHVANLDKVIKTSKNGLVLERSTRPPDAFLADFDIDGHDLKPDHKEWLEENIVRRDKAKSGINGKWLVRLIARASQSGSDAHNYALSKKRGDEVEEFLKTRIMPARLGFARHSVGESHPLDAGIYENEMDRSVHVMAEFLRWDRPKRIVPLIPKIRPWRRINKKAVDFTIQVLKAQVVIETFGVPRVPLKMGTIIVFLFLEVRELGTGDTALYEFKGHGPYSQWGRAGVSVSEWRETFENGNKHRFATERPMDAEDFGGDASLKIDGPHKGVGEGYRFGPHDFLSLPMVRIEELTFGKAKHFIPPIDGGGPAMGHMKPTTKRPSWAD